MNLLGLGRRLDEGEHRVVAAVEVGQMHQLGGEEVQHDLPISVEHLGVL